MTDNATPVNEKDENNSSSPKKEKESKSSVISDLISTIVGGAAGAFVGGVSNPFSGTSSNAESISSGDSSISSVLNSTPSGGDSGTSGKGEFGGDNTQEKSTIEVLSKIHKQLSETSSTIHQIAKDTATLAKNQTQKDIFSDISSVNAKARQNERAGTSSPVYASNRKKAEEEDSSILGSIADWFTGGKKKPPKTGPSAADKLTKKGGLESIKDAFSGWGKKEAEKGTAKKIEKAEKKGMLDKLKDAFTGPKAKKIAGGAVIGGAALGIEEELRAQGITDPYAIEAFKGKAMTESGGKGGEEGDWTHTKNSDIRKTFPQLKSKSDEELNDLKSKGNEAFLNEAYKKGGGYKYRGRGLIQLTGKSNYEAADRDLGLNGELVNNPDILATDKELDKKVSVWFYKRGLGKNKDFSSQEDANKRAIEIVGGKNYAPGTDLGKRELNKINKIQQSGKTKELVKNFTEETPKAPKDNIASTPGFSNVAYNPDTETASAFVPAAYNPDTEPATVFSGAQFPNNESKPKKSTQNELKPLGYTLSDDHEGGKNKIDIQTRKKTKATPEEINEFYGGGPVLSDEELKQKYKENPNFSTDDLRKTSADDESDKLDPPKSMIRQVKLANGETKNWKVDLESGEETLATEDDINQDKQQKELEKQYDEKQKSSSSLKPEAKTDPLSYTVETPGENSKVTTTKGSSSKSPEGFRNASETTTVTTTGGGSTLRVQEQSEEEKAKLAKEDADQKEKEKAGSSAAYDPLQDNGTNNHSKYKLTGKRILDHEPNAQEKEVLDIDQKRATLMNERTNLERSGVNVDDKETMDKQLERLSGISTEMKQLDEKRNNITGSKEYLDNIEKQKSGGKQQSSSGKKSSKSSGGGGSSKPKGNDDPTLKMMEEGTNINHNGELTA